MANLLSPHTNFVHSVYPTNKGAMILADDPLTTTSKSISGHVYDTSGSPVVGATVELYRATDFLRCAVTTSGAGGVYSFPRRADDIKTYFTVAWSIAGGSTQVHGTSNTGLVPA